MSFIFNFFRFRSYFRYTNINRLYNHFRLPKPPKLFLFATTPLLSGTVLSAVYPAYYKDFFLKKNYHKTKNLLHEVIVPGDGKTFPKDLETVKLHMTTWLLDGTEIDSTRTTGFTEQPFEFQLARSDMIDGFERGIKKMTKGERARIVVPPQLAFGESGNEEGSIPPNSILVFDVILLDIQSTDESTKEEKKTKK